DRNVTGVQTCALPILADTHGNIIHLGERECSSQRRHQKLIEESPCAFISEQLRKKLYEDAVKLTTETNYVNAGTIEFLVDVDRGTHYFIEMNTRVQVEHPVTEMVTGIDIIRS